MKNQNRKEKVGTKRFTFRYGKPTYTHSNDTEKQQKRTILAAKKHNQSKRVHIVSVLVYLHDVIELANAIVSKKPGPLVDLPLSHATLSTPLVDHACYRLLCHALLVHFDRTTIDHSIQSLRRLKLSFAKKEREKKRSENNWTKKKFEK